MLKFLSIRDFVIVSQLELDFAAGFTTLTGETGAGKSILLDALTLAMGGRGDSNMIRNGCERADICAEFDINALPQFQQWLIQQELQGDDGCCLLRRVLDKNGRSRAFINGHSATLQQLKDAGEQLINIHGQHAHQALMRPESQRALLDDYAGATTQAQQVAELHRNWQNLQRRRIHLQQNATAVAAECELLQFQRDEIAQLNFAPTEWQQLQEDYARSAHAASLRETAALGIETISEADHACLEQLNILSSKLHEGLRYDPGLSDIVQMLDSAQNELQEVVYALRHYQQHLDADPQLLQEMEQRIEDVVNIARKHRSQPEQLPDILQRIQTRLQELGGNVDLDALEQQEQIAYQNYLQAAQILSNTRQQAASKLTHEISAAMQTLAMQGGRFMVELQPLTQGQAGGLENIDFLVAANPGVPPRSLSKVASGGELSRISLAIQVATSQIAKVPTLIFDEVDTGIGGRVAEIVGHLLKQLGQNYQVLCVTHLPQVAAAANQQWQVSKAVENGITRSQIVVLDNPQRIEEIARMLGGVNITSTTRQHAKEMLGLHV